MQPVECVACVLEPEGSGILGTAFFVEPRGLLLTCEHVVAPYRVAKRAIRLRLPGSSAVDEFDANLTDNTAAAAVDIAVLNIDPDRIPDYVRCLRMADRILPRLDRAFESYGFAEDHGVTGAPASGSLVAITASLPDGMQGDWMVQCPHIQRGYSGAPIIDSRSPWRCLGVITAKWESSELAHRDSAYFVASERIIRAVDGLGSSYHPVIEPLVMRAESIARQRASTRYFDVRLLMEPPTSSTRSVVMTPFNGGKRTLAVGLRLLVGDAGIGKSTFLKELCAGLWLTPNAYGLQAPVVSALVSASSLSSENLRSVNDFCRFLQRSRGDFIGVGDADEFRDFVTSGSIPCAFLIDALDECDARQRQDIFEGLASLAKTLVQWGHLVVVTTRPSSELSISLAQLPTERKQNFGVLWFDYVSPENVAEYIEQTKGSDVARAFMELVELSPYGVSAYNKLASFLYNPFFLTALLELDPEHWPDAVRRGFVDVLDRLVQGRVDAISDVANSPDGIMDGLKLLALLETDSRRQGSIFHSSSDLALQALFNDAKRLMPSAVSPPLRRLQASQQLLHKIQSSRIASIHTHFTEWEHLILRDYLAACELVRSPVNRVIQLLLAMLDNPMWRPFWQFTLFQLEPEALTSVIKQLFRRQWHVNEEVRLEDAFRSVTRALFAGLELAPEARAIFFESLGRHAYRAQHYVRYGNASNVFMEDYGLFQFLTWFQCVPEARSLLDAASTLLPAERGASQWKTAWGIRFCQAMYSGQMASLPAAAINREWIEDPRDEQRLRERGLIDAHTVVYAI
jgi:hypothetical protein